jgi:hypothetical protein
MDSYVFLGLDGSSRIRKSCYTLRDIDVSIKGIHDVSLYTVQRQSH